MRACSKHRLHTGGVFWFGLGGNGSKERIAGLAVCRAAIRTTSAPEKIDPRGCHARSDGHLARLDLFAGLHLCLTRANSCCLSLLCSGRLRQFT